MILNMGKEKEKCGITLTWLPGIKYHVLVLCIHMGVLLPTKLSIENNNLASSSTSELKQDMVALHRIDKFQELLPTSFEVEDIDAILNERGPSMAQTVY